MPKNLQSDIDYHRARINFYRQALKEVEDDAGLVNRERRIEDLRQIIADLEHTLADLEKAIAGLA